MTYNVLWHVILFMDNRFTDKEKAFFQKFKKNHSSIRMAVFGVLLIIMVGFLVDAFNGFFLLKESKSEVHWFIGLFIAGLLYLIAEAASTWIDKKDDVSHPLHKRVFFLILLFGFFIIVALISAMGYIVWINIGKFIR